MFRGAHAPLFRKSFRKSTNLVLLTGLLIAGATGCETATTQKTRLDAHLSDITTTPPPAAHADPPGAEAQGQPPVPGSPTASNADGTQPPNDLQARNSSARRHEAESGAGKP